MIFPPDIANKFKSSSLPTIFDYLYLAVVFYPWLSFRRREEGKEIGKKGWCASLIFSKFVTEVVFEHSIFSPRALIDEEENGQKGQDCRHGRPEREAVEEPGEH